MTQQRREEKKETEEKKNREKETVEIDSGKIEKTLERGRFTGTSKV